MHYYQDTNMWKIYKLDVWRNEEDWDVNDFHEIAQIEIAPTTIDYDYRILDFLESHEYITLQQRDTSYVDSDYGWIYIRDLDTDEPILGMEMVRIYKQIKGGRNYG